MPFFREAKTAVDEVYAAEALVGMMYSQAQIRVALGVVSAHRHFLQQRLAAEAARASADNERIRAELIQQILETHR